MRKIRVLFLYPNTASELRIPLGISILSSCLKNSGHETKLFDTTFMTPEYAKDDKLMAKSGFVKETDIDKYIGKIESKDIKTELLTLLKEYDPDLVAMSLVERNYITGMKLLEYVKSAWDYPTLVGGIMPTLVPEMLIENKNVDMVCIGEGEKPIVELADRIAKGEPYEHVNNLWVKKSENVIKNKLNPQTNLDKVPFQDWEIFDLKHLYKSFEGKVYVAGSFELSRGCMKHCSFCVAPQLRKCLATSGVPYFRRKSIKRAIAEMKYFKDRYKLEMISFTDPDFLTGMRRETLMEFHDLYKEEVGLPFIIQSGAETITEERVKVLKGMNCVTISVGVEHGNAEFRKKILKKVATDKQILNCFKYLKKYGLRATANYMIGLPHETEKLVFDSIEFNKRLKPPSIAVTYFVPFLGTELYDMCVKEGFIKRFDPYADVYLESALDMPQLSKKKIGELLKVFVDEHNKVASSV